MIGVACMINSYEIVRLPMNHVKIFKGWPLQDAPSKLVQLWYKSFPPGRFLPGGNEEANYVE